MPGLRTAGPSTVVRARNPNKPVIQPNTLHAPPFHVVLGHSTMHTVFKSPGEGGESNQILSAITYLLMHVPYTVQCHDIVQR